MFFKIVHTRNFLLYSLGQAISDLGSLMTYFALSLYVLKETNSATMFAFILSIKYIPQIILYPFAGVFIDRVSRKKVMIFFDGMRGIALSLVLLLVVWNGRLSFPLVYFIIIFTAFSEVFYNLATNSIMPFLFKEDDLVLANSLSAWISNLSLILGPILGTFLYNKIGIVPILAIDTTTFFIVVGFTMFLKLIENERCLNRKTKVIQELKQGVKLITI
ncbi:MFS transporter [Desulfosporosinus sp. PR]|uniref:MFS transporter n=1 Tax=Candidatus Desulfosporosinus nitrosoreducens TaxID=3401928 RepID=UPI0027F84070|nr:MFS transporter [Desulfosporosinus sp. PR]MDQ7094792.1 MFS transporter [Desulfosporosinus sp. PR]